MPAAGLFLRYCATCNSTQTIAERGKSASTCAACGHELKVFDAHALIPALGAKLDMGQREAVARALSDRSLPRST